MKRWLFVQMAWMVILISAQSSWAIASKKANEKCALIIPGAQKNTCVTFDSVNRAFTEAKDQMPLAAAGTKTLTDIDMDRLGVIIVEATRLLAKEYNLPADAIHAGLPLIDTRRTLIKDFCPAFLKKPTCTIKRYRQFNGMCNNLNSAHWGATLAPFRRLIPPDYADGISAPRKAVGGAELPSPRYISAFHHRDMGYHDHAITVFLPAFGQLIDHDLTRGADSKDPKTDSEPKCCDVAPEQRHPACWPIEIPPNDQFYSLFRRKCMEFVRGATGLKENCKLGSRSSLNSITSVLDANFVYGSSKEMSRKLRRFSGGLLKSNPVHRDKGLKDLLPPKLEDPDAGCFRPNKDTYCFLAGDSRVNQQMMLVALHTIFMREHNRIAEEMARINPHWDDERLFQETRHIMAAVVQHITYNEFLPMVLGKEQMQRYGLILQKDGFSSTYNPKVDPSVPVSFFAAAYRFGHSLIPSSIERWSVSHKYVGGKRLSEVLLRPFDVYQGGTCDQYLAGFMNQVSQAVDDSMTQELTNHLFQDSQNNWGADLASLNMQRGRDHGVPSYNAFREFCGLKRARSWSELSNAFTNDTLRKYQEIYASPDDVDLWSAGISERPVTGSMVGPVFGCIMGETFRNLRQGDRFWYENSGWPSSFTLGQLNEIRRVKLSRIVCDNSDHIESAQVYVMVLPDPEINPRIACKSAVLPRINLELWRESQ